MRIASALAFASIALSLSLRALAAPTFPGDLEGDLTLSYTPPCSVCHTNGITGPGTVHTPFGQSMTARGLVPGDDASVGRALAKMEADKVDSDGDTVLDTDELVMGTDPNVPDKGAAPSQTGGTVAYGCGAHIAPAAHRTEDAWAVALAIAGFAMLRKRRRDR